MDPLRQSLWLLGLELFETLLLCQTFRSMKWFLCTKRFFFLEKKQILRGTRRSALTDEVICREVAFFIFECATHHSSWIFLEKVFFLLRHFEYNTSRPKTKETTRKEKEPTCTWHVCKGPGQECVFCLKGRVEFIHGGLDCFVLHSALIKPIDGVKIVNNAHDEIVRKSLSDLIVCICMRVCVRTHRLVCRNEIQACNCGRATFH